MFMNGLKIVMNVNKAQDGEVRFEGNILDFPEELRGHNILFEKGKSMIASVFTPQLCILRDGISLYICGEIKLKDHEQLRWRGDYSDLEVIKILDMFYNLVSDFNESIGVS